MIRKRIQLGLIHAALAMTLVPINSTLNRVMIKELAMSAALVAGLASLPYLFSPIQVAIGSFSDRHPLLGWRRTPYIILGLGLCAAGVVVSPRVAYLLADNFWAGVGLGAIAFGAWGMGYNFASVSYFSLASELSGEKGRSRTIAVMFFIMIVFIIGTSIALGGLLESYSQAALVRSFWVVGLAALGMGLVGILKLEKRETAKQTAKVDREPSWKEIVGTITKNRQATRFFWYLLVLLTAILGQDILLEPYGAEAFGLTVGETTRITSIWGTAFLLSLAAGGLFEGRVSKLRQAKIGAWNGVLAFGLIVLSAVADGTGTFYAGVVLLGLATGLSTVSNLSLMLDMTTVGSVGLFMGAWGMASAVSRLAGNVLSGVVRDGVTQLAQNPVMGYMVVFVAEAAMLLASLIILRGVNPNLFQKQAKQELPLVERVRLASEA